MENLKFFRESKDIIAEVVGRPRQSLPKIAFEPERKREKKGSYSDVYNNFKKSGNKPFYVMTKPNFPEQQIVHSFCGLFLKNWKKVDFLHFAALDEIFKEERTVSSDGMPSLNDPQREVVELLKEIKFDLQLAEIIPIKNAS